MAIAATTGIETARRLKKPVHPMPGRSARKPRISCGAFFSVARSRVPPLPHGRLGKLLRPAHEGGDALAERQGQSEVAMDLAEPRIEPVALAGR